MYPMRLRTERRDVTARIHEPTDHSMFAQDHRRLVRGKSLGDTTEIDPYPRLTKSDSVIG